MTRSVPVPVADLALDVDVVFHGQLCGRFGIGASADGRLGFHIVVSGEAWAHSEALPGPCHLRAGDALLFGHAVPHVVSDRRDARDHRDPEAIAALGARIALPATGLVCGYFVARNDPAADWLESLPECCVVSARGEACCWTVDLGRLMAAEAAAKRDTASCLASRAAGLFLALGLRQVCERQVGGGRLLRARCAPPLRAVLDAVDADLARPWTVAKMAAVSGVCRSKFAAWFAREVGCPPVTYLRGRRMQAAERLARGGRLDEKRLAKEVGYRSVAAFRRQYRDHCGARQAARAR